MVANGSIKSFLPTSQLIFPTAQLPFNKINTMRVENDSGSTVRISLQAPESTDVANVRSGLSLVPSQILPARDNPLEPMAITVVDAYPTHGGHSDIYKVNIFRNGAVLTVIFH